MFKYNKFSIIKSYYSTNNLNKAVSVNVVDSTTGADNIKHHPPIIRVWNNSVYNYNKNSQDNTLAKYNKLDKIIKSYFNLHNNISLARSKRMRYKRIKQRSRKLYISKPEVKQTNDKISITVYYFDKLKHSLIRKIFFFNRPRIVKFLYQKKDRRKKRIKRIKLLERHIKHSGMKQMKNSKLFKDRNRYKKKYIEQSLWLFFFKYLLSLINVRIYYPVSLPNNSISKKKKAKRIKSLIIRESLNINNLINSNPNIVFWIDFNNYCFEKIENKNLNSLYLTTKVINYYNSTMINHSKKNNYLAKLNFVSQINKKLSEIVNMFVVTNIISKSLLLKAYNYMALKAYKGFAKKMYKKRYNKISKLTNLSMANLIKFKSLLPTLKMVIDTFYNKKTELNMINLKYFHLNSDIYTQAIITKLKKKLSPKRLINKSLNKVKVISYYNHRKQLRLNNLNKLLSYTSISADTLPMNFLPFKENKLKLDRLQMILKKIFPQNLLQKYNTVKRIFRKKTSNILNIVKYKAVLGMRIEANGRLTRRHKAARSVSHLVYKGNLKDTNIYYNEKDQEDQNRPTVLLRNDVRANTQFNYKPGIRRIGSFGIKTWISGK